LKKSWKFRYCRARRVAGSRIRYSYSKSTDPTRRQTAQNDRPPYLSDSAVDMPTSLPIRSAGRRHKTTVRPTCRDSVGQTVGVCRLSFRPVYRSDRSKQETRPSYTLLRAIDSGNLFLDACKFRTGVGRAGDLPSHYQVIGAGLQGFSRGGDALLVACCASGRPDTGRDDHYLGRDRPHRRSLARRGDDAADACLYSLFCPANHQFACRAIIAELPQIVRTEAGQHRYGEEFQARPAFALHGRAHYRADRVDRQKSHSRLRHEGNSPLHGFGDVVELEIQEDLLALVGQFVNEVQAGGRVEIQPDLVEIGSRAETRHNGTRFIGRIHVERDDYGVMGHMRRIHFSWRGSTRPITTAPGREATSSAASSTGR